MSVLVGGTPLKKLTSAMLSVFCMVFHDDHKVTSWIIQKPYGIHPTRLALLLQLIEQKVFDGNVQMVATTHSPHLLGLVSQTTLEYASVIYRLPNSSDGRMKQILDIPDAKRLIEKQGASRLHASGWFEYVIDFLEAMEETP